MDYRPLRTTRDVRNLKGRPGWYRIVPGPVPVGMNQAPTSTQVTIYDEIGFLGVAADSFMQELAAISGDIDLHINSPGGDAHSGIAIYNQLKQRPGILSVVVDGLAASAASFIAMAASPGRLKMAPHSQMMIHNGFGMAIGDADDMEQMAALLRKTTANIAGIYADRTGKPKDYWLGKMAAETWYDDHEAVAEGLADGILGQDPPAGSWDLSVYQNSAGKPSGGRKAAYKRFVNEKYSADDRKAMAADGRAMPDGSYPIDNEDDLHNAVHAVGRGGSDHDAIRRHIIKRAHALKHPEAIPDNWNADGSMQTSPDNLSEAQILAMFARELDQLDAGRE